MGKKREGYRARASTTAYSMFPRVTDYSIYKPCRMILNRGTHTGREFAGSITGIRCLSSRSHIALLFLHPFTLLARFAPERERRETPPSGSEINSICASRVRRGFWLANDTSEKKIAAYPLQKHTRPYFVI